MATAILQIMDTLISNLQKTGRWKYYFVFFGIFICQLYHDFCQKLYKELPF